MHAGGVSVDPGLDRHKHAKPLVIGLAKVTSQKEIRDEAVKVRRVTSKMAALRCKSFLPYIKKAAHYTYDATARYSLKLYKIKNAPSKRVSGG